MTRSIIDKKRYQSRWRLAGTISLAAAALLAAGSVWSGILRDTAVHTVRVFAGRVPEGVEANSGLVVCVLYWTAFLVSLGAAFYLAFLDMRYIRLQYALEQQKLFKESLGDEYSAALLDKRRRQ